MDDPETIFNKKSPPGVEQDRLEEAVCAGCWQLFNRQLNRGFFFYMGSYPGGILGLGVRKKKRCSEPVGRDDSQFRIL